MSDSNRQCAHYQRQLLLLRDADRSGGQPLAVAEHLGECSACSDEFQELVSFEEKVHARLQAGHVLTEALDLRLRQTYRVVSRRGDGAQRTRHFATRTWSSVASVAAMLMIAIFVAFVVSPDLKPATASLYSGERSETATLSEGDEYHLVLQSTDASWVYVINVDAETATLVYPYRTEDGLDYLGYPDAQLAARESRIVPHLDSGAAYSVQSTRGSTENFFVVSSPNPVALELVESGLVSLQGVDTVRAWLESRFETVSHFAFEVE